ncbi:uncharacterized protein BT62DRAFT_996487, partial [Guyanagaster necrorhizus]
MSSPIFWYHLIYQNLQDLSMIGFVYGPRTKVRGSSWLFLILWSTITDVKYTNSKVLLEATKPFRRQSSCSLGISLVLIYLGIGESRNMCGIS